MVLDHATDDGAGRNEHGMTRRYTQAQLLGFKAPVMGTWERLLEPAAASVDLPPIKDLKRELVRRRAEQRGVDLDKDRERLRRLRAA